MLSIIAIYTPTPYLSICNLLARQGKKDKDYQDIFATVSGLKGQVEVKNQQLEQNAGEILNDDIIFNNSEHKDSEDDNNADTKEAIIPSKDVLKKRVQEAIKELLLQNTDLKNKQNMLQKEVEELQKIKAGLPDKEQQLQKTQDNVGHTHRCKQHHTRNQGAGKRQT